MLVATELIEKNQIERVDFTRIPETFGYVYRLQEIAYRAKAELEISYINLLLSHPNLISDGDEYLKLISEKQKWHYILFAMEIGYSYPEPPGGIKREEHKVANNKKYYSVRSLWDLKHILDLEDANRELYLNSREVYYLNEIEMFWNHSYYDYSDGGTEFLMSEEIYYVEDIGRWVMVETCYNSY